MDRIRTMLGSHPHPASSAGNLAHAAITAALECASICTTCADACLAEEDVAKQRNCIRLNLDCADLCTTTAILLSRPSHRDQPTLNDLLQACADACKACGDERDRHAAHMEHCRICAECCRACEKACRAMRDALVK